MVGLTLAEGKDAAAIAAYLLEEGLVLNVPGERMLRLLPPLVIDEGDVESGASHAGGRAQLTQGRGSYTPTLSTDSEHRLRTQW